LRIDATSLGEGRGSVRPAQQYQVAAEFGQLVFGSMPVRLEPSLAVWKEGDDLDTLFSELGRGCQSAKNFEPIRFPPKIYCISTPMSKDTALASPSLLCKQKFGPEPLHTNCTLKRLTFAISRAGNGGTQLQILFASASLHY
jgi:hypothetical protein